MTKIFKIKNLHTGGLAMWLNKLSLMGKESRQRSRFVKLLIARIEENGKFYEELLTKYVKKDGKGVKLKVGKGDKEKWDIKDSKAFEKEYKELVEEEYAVELTAGNGEMFLMVKHIVLDTDYKFGPEKGDNAATALEKTQLANGYNEWCASFEDLL